MKESGPEHLGAARHSPAFGIALAVLVLGYAALMAWLSLLRFEAFQAHAFDLGNYDQALWNTLHGRPFLFTNRGVDWFGPPTRLATHAEPLLLPLSLLYLFYSSPRALLVFQSLALATGALPVFWLARSKVRSEAVGLSFAAAYLLMPSLHAANLYDFHPVALAAPLLLFAFYFLEVGRYGWFAVFAGLAAASKEEVGLLVFMMGLYLLLVRKGPWRVGVPACVLGLGWSLAAVFFIIPAFNPEGTYAYWYRYQYLNADAALGGGLATLVPALRQLASPTRLGQLLPLLTNSGFFSLLAPEALLLGLPSFLISLLSANQAQHSFQHQYGATVVPFVVAAGVLGTARLVGWTGQLWGERGREAALWGVAALVLVAALTNAFANSRMPLTGQVGGVEEYRPLRAVLLAEARAILSRRGSDLVTDHARAAAPYLKRIPDDAAVSAQANLNPHLSQREKLYLFPDMQDAEFIVLDMDTLAPAERASAVELANSMLKYGEFGVVAMGDGYVVMQKGAPTKTERLE